MSKTKKLIKKTGSRKRRQRVLLYNKLNVITYNICWGCMTNNINRCHLDKTARKIACTCANLYNSSNGRYSCARNNYRFLEETIKIYGELDIIALQEAHNWSNIYNLLLQKQSNISVINTVVYSNGLPIDIATFYNKDKIKPRYIYVGDVDNNGRPYHIILAECKSLNNTVNKNRNGVIIVNIHNSHHHNKFDLERILSERLKNYLPFKCSYGIDNYISIGIDDMVPIDNTIDTNDIINWDRYARIIFSGDTNIHTNKYKDFHNSGFIPFKYSDIPSIKNIIVSSGMFDYPNSTPPRSCCVGYNKLRSNLYEDFASGDFILIGGKLRYNTSPNSIIPSNMFIPTSYIADAKYAPQSDHIPIMSQIVVD